MYMQLYIHIYTNTYALTYIPTSFLSYIYTHIFTHTPTHTIDDTYTYTVAHMFNRPTLSESVTMHKCGPAVPLPGSSHLPCRHWTCQAFANYRCLESECLRLVLVSPDLCGTRSRLRIAWHLTQLSRNTLDTVPLHVAVFQGKLLGASYMCCSYPNYE